MSENHFQNPLQLPSCQAAIFLEALCLLKIICNCPGCGLARPEIVNSTDITPKKNSIPWASSMGGRNGKEEVGLRPTTRWGRKAPDPMSWHIAHQTRHNLGSYNENKNDRYHRNFGNCPRCRKAWGLRPQTPNQDVGWSQWTRWLGSV